jgi:hypothetical protein
LEPPASSTNGWLCSASCSTLVSRESVVRLRRHLGRGGGAHRPPSSLSASRPPRDPLTGTGRSGCLLHRRQALAPRRPRRPGCAGGPPSQRWPNTSPNCSTPRSVSQSPASRVLVPRTTWRPGPSARNPPRPADTDSTRVLRWSTPGRRRRNSALGAGAWDGEQDRLALRPSASGSPAKCDPFQGLTEDDGSPGRYGSPGVPRPLV